jgi:hypothetical protein
MATSSCATTEELLEMMFSTWSVPRGYIARTPAEESVERESVKRRLGGWCEMEASLGVS